MNLENAQPHNFKILLQEELVTRCRKNPRYSLRSFAKTLDVSPAALSDMINGKRTITKRSVEKLGLLLGLSIPVIESFRKVLPSRSSSASALNFEQLSADQFAVISDWYHYAILELIKVRDFDPSEAWISKALGVTKSEVNIALERLVRLGLIEIEATGKITDTSSGFTTNISDSMTSTANRNFQQQVLGQSIEALNKVPLKLRNHTSMTMAIDPKLLPEAVKRLTVFRRELSEFLETQGTPTEVYQLALSLFPLTQITKDSKTGELHEKH
ncbi:MAG TPA: TIGR02147 family protein [Bacteriovoracaceae bacterium]|nr:TIGR02147 family protein [Bacteriovoracaceae bacterium]